MPDLIGGLCDGSSVKGTKIRPVLLVLAKWSGVFYLYLFDKKSGTYEFEEWFGGGQFGERERKKYKTAVVVTVDYQLEETVAGYIPSLEFIDQEVLT